jgi:NADPH-dependent 2,4-dienoyl-CoA reductase/sulfur reductase-like enzyme
VTDSTVDAELTIVGAGPAGLAAAVQAAELGLDVTVIDEQLRIGGQIYRQPPATFTRSAAASSRDVAKARALFERVERHRQRVQLRLDTLVWGAIPAAPTGTTLSLSCGGRSETLRAQALILATGATERVYPFSGWTLPGVYTAGAMQVLLKSQFILPGKRVAVAGTGPLLLVLAEQLHEAGA